jgi:hypothetical protein
MNDDRSDARNNTALAMSADAPSRGMGVWRRYMAWPSGEIDSSARELSVRPGSTALQRMPALP